MTGVPLISDIYITGNNGQPCPRCALRAARRSVEARAVPRRGPATAVPGPGCHLHLAELEGLTNDCLTGGMDATHPCGIGGNGPCIDGSHQGPINVNLFAALHQSGPADRCVGVLLPQPAEHGLLRFARLPRHHRERLAAGPVAANTPANAVLASIFCIQATGSGVLDGAASLPGPGACLAPS